MRDREDLTDDMAANERDEHWLAPVVLVVSVVALTVGAIVTLWTVFG